MRHLTVLPVLFCLAATGAFADGVGNGTQLRQSASKALVPEPDTFGTSSVTVYTIGAFAFTTTTSSAVINHIND